MKISMVAADEPEISAEERDGKKNICPLERKLALKRLTDGRGGMR